MTGNVPPPEGQNPDTPGFSDPWEQPTQAQWPQDGQAQNQWEQPAQPQGQGPQEQPQNQWGQQAHAPGQWPPQQQGPPQNQPAQSGAVPFSHNPYSHQSLQQQQPVSGLAVTSMVLGIVSIVFLICFWPVAVVLSLVGFPLGLVGLSQSNKGRAGGGSKGMAIAGIVLNSIMLVLIIILFVILGVAFATLSAG